MRPGLITYLLLSLLLSGCLSEVPISKRGTFKVDKSLQGLWADRDGDMFVKVVAKNDDSYAILVYFNNANTVPVELSAFPTKIADQVFLNMKTVKSNETFIIPDRRRYFFCRYVKYDDRRLKIFGLKGDLLKNIHSSEDLYSFFKNQLYSKSLFEKKPLNLSRL